MSVSLFLPLEVLLLLPIYRAGGQAQGAMRPGPGQRFIAALSHTFLLVNKPISKDLTIIQLPSIVTQA